MMMTSFQQVLSALTIWRRVPKLTGERNLAAMAEPDDDLSDPVMTSVGTDFPSETERNRHLHLTTLLTDAAACVSSGGEHTMYAKSFRT